MIEGMSQKEKEKASGKSFFGKFGETLRGGNKSKERPKVGGSFDSCSTSSSSSGWFANSESTKDLDQSPVSQVGFDFSHMTVEEIELMFEKMLDDMNLNDSQKEPLRSGSLDNKKLLLSQKVRTDNTARGGKVKYDSPYDYIKLLNSPIDNIDKLDKILESLRVSLSNNAVSWIQNFGPRGLTLLVETLKWVSSEMQENSDDVILKHAQHECVKCLKAFMNNKYGLLEIFENDQALIALVQSLSFYNIPAMVDSIKLLAAISLYNSDSHSKVLEAFTVAAEIEQRFRFSVVVSGVYENDNYPLQDACMQLINALITTPDDLDMRLCLRNEIVRTGLNNDIIEHIEECEHEDLKRQVQIFVEHKENDFDEFYQRFENIRGEFETTAGCYEMLIPRLKGTSAEPYFLSILQHLILIRDDVTVRAAYFKLIDEVISQIVLFKNGVDPDFRYHRRFQIDVEEVVDKIIEKSREFDQLNVNSQAVEDIKKKLDVAITAKQETDARLLQYYSKIEEFARETSLLREKLKKEGHEITIRPTELLPPPSIGGLTFETTTGTSPANVPPQPLLPPFAGHPPRPAPPLPPGMIPPMLGNAPRPPPPLSGAMGAGIRAPPPPPPFGMPAPPPLGGLLRMPAAKPEEPELPKFLPAKKFYKTDAKLKKLNWKPIAPNALTEEACWAKTAETEFESDDLFCDIKNTFSTKSVLSKGPNNNGNETSIADSASTINGISAKRTKKKKELKVLDAKAGQSLAILQGSLKMSHEEFCRALWEIDESRLYEPTLQQLIATLPPDDQMKQLDAYKDKMDELAEAECFLLKINAIGRLKSRLQCICFKLKFIELINDVKPEIAAATEACEEVRNSRGFFRVLEIVLLIGNYLNAGSKNGAVYAFDMNFLTKLNDTKAQDGRHTLLHFIVKVMETKCKSASDFTKDFTHVVQAARFSPSDVQKQLTYIDQSIKKLKSELSSYQRQNDYDRFHEVMSSFMEKAASEYSVIENMHKRLQGTYANLARYFAFDPKKCAMDEFFGDLKRFKEQYEQAVLDNIRIRETEEKINRAKEMKEKAEQAKRERQAQKKSIIDMSCDGNQEGVMDNLMEALRSGQAFPQRSRTPGKRAPREDKGGRQNVYTRRRSRDEF